MRPPPWLFDVLETKPVAEGGEIVVDGRPLLLEDGILRAPAMVSSAQAQTSEAFGFKWAQRDTFDPRKCAAAHTTG